MAENTDTRKNTFGKSLRHNWVEERAVAALDNEETKMQNQRRGHRGILTIDQGSKMENVTTVKAAYIPPKGPGVRLRGIRGELLEEYFAQMISVVIKILHKLPAHKETKYPVVGCRPAKKKEEFVSPSVEMTVDMKSDSARTVNTRVRDNINAERNPPTPKTDFCSTTQKDFCVEGYVPHPPELSETRDYKTDPAVTFWSEKYQQIQGVTAVQTLKAPFRKSSKFSKPISEQLDETEFPPDN